MLRRNFCPADLQLFGGGGLVARAPHCCGGYVGMRVYFAAGTVAAVTIPDQRNLESLS